MKKTLIALVVISLVLLSGVSGCNNKTNTKASNIGLQMNFVQSAPPASITVNKEFPIYIDVQNMGEEYVNVGQAKFYLTGAGQNLENVVTAVSNEKTLSKASAYPDRIVFADNAKYNFPLQDTFVSTLVLTSCYDYGGVAQATICVAGSNDSKVCSLSGEKALTNTAGPVQLSNLVETLDGNTLQVVFDVAKVATSGQVYLPETDCDKLQSKDALEGLKQEKLGIEIRTDDNFLCRLQSEEQRYGQIMALKGNVPLGKVLCEMKLKGDEDYKSPFAVIIRYKYRDSINTNINILPSS